MKEEKNDIQKLAILYFEGRISRADESLLFNYIKEDRGHAVQFRQWEQEWKSSHQEDWAVTREWKRLQCKIRTKEAITPMVVKTYPLWKKVAAIAAMVVCVSGATWGVMQVIANMQRENFYSVETPYGEKSKVTLADGTTVWLNAGSSLQYSDKFDHRNRRVRLVGEGYFEVAKHEGATFVVETKGYDVTVKGTKFNVSAYPEDAYVATTLFEGAVDIDCKGKTIAMKPGESVRMDLASGKFSKSLENVSQYKAWQQNRIEYDAITLNELLPRLSRQYDVNIVLLTPVAEQKQFRISIRNQETIGEVLDALSKIIPITIERKGKDIYIKE